MKPYFENENGKLYHGDCLEIMFGIADDSFDMVCCDLPYAVTECKWDKMIPTDKIWEHYKRICKNNAAVVLNGIQPFTSKIILSNIEMFKYCLVWRKSRIGNFAQAKYRFLNEHEDIMVFSRGGLSGNAAIKMSYNPQGLENCHKQRKDRTRPSEHKPGRKQRRNYIQTKTNYPKSVLEFKSASGKLHPTQKPLKLIEYLIKTYTNEGDTVLDNCVGSGTTLAACENLKRKWIGIEKEKKYCEIAAKRVIG